MNLSHIALGQQAITSEVMNALFALRQSLEVEERELIKQTNKQLGTAALLQSNAAYNSTSDEAESMQKQGMGDILGTGLQAAFTTFGEYQAKQANGEVATANIKVDEIQNQIAEKTAQLDGIVPAIAEDADDMPLNAGQVEQQAQLQKEIDTLGRSLENARNAVSIKENAVGITAQHFQQMGQGAAGAITGGFKINASKAISDKAKQDAASAIYQYSQQVLGKIGDALSQMAQAQASSTKDLAQMLSALTQSNTAAA